jgi:hypothetical protein
MKISSSFSKSNKKIQNPKNKTKQIFFVYPKEQLSLDEKHQIPHNSDIENHLSREVQDIENAFRNLQNANDKLMTPTFQKTNKK